MYNKNETFEAAVAVCNHLNKAGMAFTIDTNGEGLVLVEVQDRAKPLGEMMFSLYRWNKAGRKSVILRGFGLLEEAEFHHCADAIGFVLDYCIEYIKAETEELKYQLENLGE